MQTLSNITLIARRVGLFALVLGVLAVVARIEPGREETKSYPIMAKIVKPKSASGESSGWVKGLNWFRKG